jgi:hypothetical protein
MRPRTASACLFPASLLFRLAAYLLRPLQGKRHQVTGLVTGALGQRSSAAWLMV